MLYWVFRYIFLVIFKVFFRLKTEGKENIPKRSNFIVVSNHTSFLDPLIIGVAIPRKIYWIAFRSIYHKLWLKFLMIVSKSLPTGSASGKAAYLLMNNKNVGLFPEGQRSHDGNLGQFRRGAALLAIKTARLVLPCAISGAYEALPRHARFPKFRRIKIKIGRPIHLLKQYTEQIDDLHLQEGTFKIRRAVKELMDV